MRTIEDTLTSIDRACVLVVFMTQSYMSRVSGLGGVVAGAGVGVGVGLGGRVKSKGSHYHDLCMQLFMYATSSSSLSQLQLHQHHRQGGAGSFLVVVQEESCRDPAQWQGPCSLLASSLRQPAQPQPPQLPDTQMTEPPPATATAVDDANPLTAAGAGATAGDLSQKVDNSFTHFIDNVHDTGLFKLFTFFITTLLTPYNTLILFNTS